MIRSSRVTAIFSLLLSLCGLIQAAQHPHRVTVFLPADLVSEKVEAHYVLYGPFGAYGGTASPKADSQSVEIRTVVDGKPASQVRMFVWAAGCRIATFDVPLPEFSDVYLFFPCIPLSTISLIGQINDPDLLRKKPAEVRVDYLDSWACGFFDFADCMVPQFSLGIAKPDAEGIFEIDLPDFSADPISSGADDKAEIQFVLREIGTWNLIAFLEPTSEELRTPAGALRPASSYPQNLVFVPRKVK